MSHRYCCASTVLLVCCCFFARTVPAFLVKTPFRSTPNRRHVVHDDNSNTRLTPEQRQDERIPAASVLSMAWSAEERTEILRGLADWQERDVDGIGAADVKILKESSPTAVLTRYYESLAAGEAQQMLLVAPSCTIESGIATAVEAALSSACVSRVYHPDVPQGLGGRAPHLALWHEEVSADVFSPSSVLEEQTASLPQKAVMEEVFLWLQRTMLGMADDEEDNFVQLGRKLLTVHKYLVVNATTEAELSRAFWQEATALAKHGKVATEEKERKEKEAAEKAAAKKAAAEKEAEERAKTLDIGVEDEEKREAEVPEKTAKEKAREEVQEMLEASGLGGRDNPKEDSVLLALPGFRFKDRAVFEAFVEDKLAAPLEALSPLGLEGAELSAAIYAGEDLKFPIIILSPYLETYEAPEGGYKYINGRGEEQDADAYIQAQELKLAEEANERMKNQQQDPLFGPRSSSTSDEDLN